jgi:sulfopyruvate decarboxylase subunit beta
VQRPEEELIGMLKLCGVDFTASLPCEKIKTLLEMLETSFHHVPLTREEEGVGICAGAALSGKRPAMFVQSSGIGNMINALLSLTAFYELPLALFVSRRGIYKEKIKAQFPMGQKLPGILSGADIGWTEINTYDDLKKVEQELPEAYNRNRIHAFLMSPKVWEGSECGVQNAERGIDDGKTIKRIGPSVVRSLPSPTLTRYDIIKIAAPYLEGKVVVSNLGWPSKELFAIRPQHSNFYMLGSMGMATPIGLGIALTSKKDVVVIDGDGSILMNPGTLATAASLAPKNLTILCIDNGAYGSTGNQPTLAGSCVDLEQVARGFGFGNTAKAAGEKEIDDMMKRRKKGLTFIHALAIPGNKDVPNLPLHHLEIKRLVQEFIQKKHVPVPMQNE